MPEITKRFEIEEQEGNTISERVFNKVEGG
jgi:hypothetical protein